jgi:hypothetical protein
MTYDKKGKIRMNSPQESKEIDVADLKDVEMRLPPFDAREKLGIEKEVFTTFDIRENLGIKIDRLKDWMNRGFISPSIQKATGQGTKNLFSRWDLYSIKLFQYLIDRGFSRKDAAESIKDFICLEWPIFNEALGTDHPYVGFVRTIDDKGKSKIVVRDLSIDIPLADYVGSSIGKGFCDILVVDFKRIRDEVNAAIA